MPAVRRKLFVQLITFSIIASALLLTVGNASAKPDPAPFQPGSQRAVTYGPCQMRDDVVAWKCLHYKLLEARRLTPEAICSLIAITHNGPDTLTWQCESE